MNKKLNFNRLFFNMTFFSIVLLSVTQICIANEKEEIISERDAYTFVLCYYDDALDYAIANLKSQDTNSQKFAMDIATRIVNLRLQGDDPSKEITLYSLFQETEISHHLKFKSAVAQARIGSTEGLDILLEEFQSKELSYDSRLHALRFILEEVDPLQFKVLFEQALSDNQKVAVLGALGLYRIGDEKATQWFLMNIPKPPQNRPTEEFLEVIQEAKVTETIPLLKIWLNHIPSGDNEVIARAKQLPVAVTLAILGDREGKDFLRDILSMSKENAVGVVGQAALCVAGLGDQSFIPMLRNALNVRIKTDRYDVMEALLILNDSSVVQELLNEINANDSWGMKAAQLAIKYKVKQALPLLQDMFDQRNQKEQLEIYVRKVNTLAYYKQLGISEKDYINSVYTEKSWECVTLAMGIFQMGSEKGVENIQAVLSRDDFQYIEIPSIRRLFNMISEHRIVEVIPYLPSMLDLANPSYRAEALICLHKLTGQKLPPERKVWEQWIKESEK